jgi:AbrB family looped-hinge helix DNA binding protein
MKGFEMPDVAITRISTRGQIVIPKKFRDKYGFKAGDHFLIFGYEDTILIKKIKIFDVKKDFKEAAKKMQKKAKEMGITEEMVQMEIAQYRKEKRNKSNKM